MCVWLLSKLLMSKNLARCAIQMFVSVNEWSVEGNHMLLRVGERWRQCQSREKKREYYGKKNGMVPAYTTSTVCVFTPGGVVHRVSSKPAKLKGPGSNLAI